MSRLTRLERRAFTLFELLVVLALLILVLGLLLPVVQRIQDAANRVRCSNNLHEIVIATHNFDSVHETLPPAVGPMPNTRGDGTVFFLLLPYMEQDEIYKGGRDEAGDPSPWGGGVYAKPVQNYLCPSDRTGGPDHLFRNWLATSSYAGNYLLFGTGGASIARIPDGTANTLAFAERYQICNDQPCAWAYSGDSTWAPVFAHTS
jgi:type II secretory pathway pseudopilin PulG